jgi:hypothetical protein
MPRPRSGASHSEHHRSAFRRGRHLSARGRHWWAGHRHVDDRTATTQRGRRCRHDPPAVHSRTTCDWGDGGALRALSGCARLTVDSMSDGRSLPRAPLTSCTM